jgi:predicted nuclease of restriction endonuclease-like (RecB) superfamily
MKNFYALYSSRPKLQPVVAEIGWTRNLIIMEKCGEDMEREFYIRMTRRMGWSKSVLVHQIENDTYHTTLAHQTNFDRSLPKPIRQQAKLAVKDEYIFDFLELDEEHNERQLEKAILARIDRFLREMGGAISFVGSQYRLEVGDKEYFIDILLYHRHLKCLVALELKIGEFLPEYVGKMQFYLTALDRHVRTVDENPSIGIIVCKSKDKTIVEYALQQSKKPIGVAIYHITKRLTGKLRRELPSPEQVANLLEVI